MKKILLIFLVVFIIIQFFPIDKSNPAPTPQMDFLTIKNTPAGIAKLIRQSCYDCHSNETRYYWYSHLQPVGWLVKNHIDEGRRKLNFSTFAVYEPRRQAHKLYEAAEVTAAGEMPLDSYVVAHTEAKLTASQRKELSEYFTLIEQDTRRAYNLPAEKYHK